MIQYYFGGINMCGIAGFSSFDKDYTAIENYFKSRIDILKKMAAPYVLLSHREPFVQKKQAVISWLEKIYAMREKNEPWILMTGQNVPN